MLARKMFERLRQQAEPEPEPPNVEALENEPEAAALSDAGFLRSLRASVDQVRAGTVRSIAATEHKVPQMRPWSKKRRPRDRRGSRIY